MHPPTNCRQRPNPRVGRSYRRQCRLIASLASLFLVPIAVLAGGGADRGDFGATQETINGADGVSVKRVTGSENQWCTCVPAGPLGRSDTNEFVAGGKHGVGGTQAGNPLVDVMVVYTPSSRIAVGGTQAIEALIDSYFVYTNMVYESSGVLHRFRLVHAQEIDYVESGNSLTDLMRLRGMNDGFMDEVHPLRDESGADLVSLINTSGSAGVAYLMQELSVGFESSAFSAIAPNTGPIPVGLVFAHETAHNMGSTHNNTPGAAQGVFCYSFGHRTADEQWRTVMSAFPGTFVDFFSSPDLSVDGMPLGVNGDGCPPDAADNVRSLNESAATVAQFRPTMVPCGSDSDCDGDVDLLDYPLFVACMTGPGLQATIYCAGHDHDRDGDVDCVDFAHFQRTFTGGR